MRIELTHGNTSKMQVQCTELQQHSTGNSRDKRLMKSLNTMAIKVNATYVYRNAVRLYWVS